MLRFGGPSDEQYYDESTDSSIVVFEDDDDDGGFTITTRAPANTTAAPAVVLPLDPILVRMMEMVNMTELEARFGTEEELELRSSFSYTTPPPAFRSNI